MLPPGRYCSPCSETIAFVIRAGPLRRMSRKAPLKLPVKWKGSDSRTIRLPSSWSSTETLASLISYSFSDVGMAGMTAAPAKTTAVRIRAPEQAEDEAHQRRSSTAGAVWTSARR